MNLRYIALFHYFLRFITTSNIFFLDHVKISIWREHFRNLTYFFSLPKRNKLILELIEFAKTTHQKKLKKIVWKTS